VNRDRITTVHACSLAAWRRAAVLDFSMIATPTTVGATSWQLGVLDQIQILFTTSPLANSYSSTNMQQCM
jgi:hypothetical protein